MLKYLTALFVLGASLCAQDIAWNTWSSISTGDISDSALTSDISVSFSGDPMGIYTSYPSYLPSSTWADGIVVGNPPLSTNGILRLFGGNTHTQTITFSSPVTNPVMAIWSLGSPITGATFEFTGMMPSFVSGGPNAEYGGSAITLSGSTVSGHEGNGTIQFNGTFSSISWTNPFYENWYGLNVGIPVAHPWTNLGFGLAGVTGVPSLDGTGPLTLASLNSIDLSGAAASAPAVLAIGGTSLYAPFLGGTLVPYPALLAPIVTDGAGMLHIPLVMPPVPAGTALYMQCWIQDVGAPLGYAASNGLKATAG